MERRKRVRLYAKPLRTISCSYELTQEVFHLGANWKLEVRPSACMAAKALSFACSRANEVDEAALNICAHQFHAQPVADLKPGGTAVQFAFDG